MKHRYEYEFQSLKIKLPWRCKEQRYLQTVSASFPWPTRLNLRRLNRPMQNGHPFVNDISKCIFWWNLLFLIQISLMFSFLMVQLTMSQDYLCSHSQCPPPPPPPPPNIPTHPPTHTRAPLFNFRNHLRHPYLQIRDPPLLIAKALLELRLSCTNPSICLSHLSVISVQVFIDERHIYITFISPHCCRVAISDTGYHAASNTGSNREPLTLKTAMLLIK